MIKTVVIDDDIMISSIINRYCEENQFIDLTSTFNDPSAAINYLNRHKIDLLLIDVEMPEMTGLELLDKLTYKPFVIFITSYEKYAIDSFNYDVVDYLLKPINRERFNLAIDKLQKLQGVDEYDIIEIKHDRQLSKIRVDHILFVEAYGDYVKLYIGEKVILTNTTLKTILDRLDDDFVQVHRKYAVNKNKITSLKTDFVTIDAHDIPVSRTYKNILKKEMK